MSADPPDRSTIRLRRISKSFAAGLGSCAASVSALDDTSIEIRGGEALLVCGPCGAGKTTLLLCAAGMLHCDAGDVVTRAGRVVYRDLASPLPILDGWVPRAALLLDSCDGLGELRRAGTANAIATALATGSAVVLAARDPARCFDLVPAAVSVSIMHLRRGKVTDHRTEIGIAHRVAEGGRARY